MEIEADDTFANWREEQRLIDSHSHLDIESHHVEIDLSGASSHEMRVRAQAIKPQI